MPATLLAHSPKVLGEGIFLAVTLRAGFLALVNAGMSKTVVRAGDMASAVRTRVPRKKTAQHEFGRSARSAPEGGEVAGRRKGGQPGDAGHRGGIAVAQKIGGLEAVESGGTR
jgi:hypothetical protein